MAPKVTSSAPSSSRKASSVPSAKALITSGSRKAAVRRNNSQNTIAKHPFPPGDIRNKYVITDRSKFDIEELAQREWKYTRIFTEEQAHLSTDPARRDEVITALSNHPKVANTISPEAIVPMAGDLHANDYLAWVDRELEKTPVTFEHVFLPIKSLSRHALRMNLAFAGALIFQEYIKLWGLYCFPKDRRAVNRRVTELNNEFMAIYSKKSPAELACNETYSTVAPTSSNPSPVSPAVSDTSSVSSSLPSSSSALSSSDSSSVTAHSSTSKPKITVEQADEWMSNLLTSALNHLYFRFIGADDSDNEQSGTWRLKGIEMRKRKAVYQMLWTFPQDNSCIIPYDQQSFRDLLLNSEIAGEIKDDNDDDNI